MCDVLSELFVDETDNQDCDDPTVTCPDDVNVTFHMHLDADRDGKVDDDISGLASWQWGVGKKGAIILCNNDDDENARALDNADGKVNKGNDKDELAPLVIRKAGPDSPPASWTATLEVSPADKDRIRIFESRAAGAKEIIGPTKGPKHKLPNLGFTEKEFGLEATQYAGSTWNGEVMIIFTIDRGSKGKTVETGMVRVAPWMMPNHLDKAEKVFVVDAGSHNSRFVGELSTLVSGAGCSLKKHPEGDIWMQDCMEFGFANLPPAQGFRSVIRAARDRPLQTFPKTLLKPDLGYHEPATPGESTFDSTGNLECAPPVTSKAGKKYPFGRIYFGPGGRAVLPGDPPEVFHPEVAAFLENQVVQAPIKIDTNWLLVGHVDEIVSTVPAPGKSKHGFKLLIASPDLAFKILEDNKAKHGSSKLLKGRTFPELSPDSAEVSIKEFLDRGLPKISSKLRISKLRSFNASCQSKLKSIRSTLESELGLEAGDIIEVPILFAELTLATFADAVTAGMVNMLVVNSHCVVPKPFGPVVGGKDLFEEDLKGKLTPLGLKVHYIDDWFEYHVQLGEVHCGTNTLREPTSAKWWEFEP